MTGHAIQGRVREERRCDKCLSHVRPNYVGAPTPWWCGTCRAPVKTRKVRVHV